MERECAIIDVAGVGYEVHMTARELGALCVGEAVSVAVETVVREDLIRLYGFRDAAGRDCFRLLQGVQGVGAKVAMGVLSVLPPAALAEAVACGDRVAVARAPGVGKRVAERIVGELASRAPTSVLVVPASEAVPAGGDDTLADAVSALVKLGYEEGEARAALTRLRRDTPDAGAAELIRGGLKALAA